MTPSFSGIIFDLDGTLIDSFDSIRESLHHVCGLFGVRPLPDSEVKAMIGPPIGNSFKRIFGAERAEEALAAFRKKYEQLYLKRTRLVEGAAETLKVLREKGYRLGLSSNKRGLYVRRLVAHFGLDGLFVRILGADDGFLSKPETESLMAILDAMGLPPEEVLLVGDSPLDIEAGRRAGLTVWAVTTGYSSPESLKEARPDRMIESIRVLGELPRAKLRSPRPSRLRGEP